MKKTWFCDTVKIFFCLALFWLFGISVCYLSSQLPTSDLIASADVSEYTFILDAGHGGEDAGAIGINGVYEKDINLSICNMLAEVLKTNGFNVILTRTEDRLLYTEEENIKGHRKHYDLKNRLKFAEENPDAIFISIHMNNFPQESCRGMQVYYPPSSEESRLLACEIQNMVKSTLQDYNTRQVKASEGNIYLLDNAKGTAVLIECGFLSNREECEKLSSKDYQTQLSFQIFCGIMEYIKK